VRLVLFGELGPVKELGYRGCEQPVPVLAILSLSLPDNLSPSTCR
jgi:hypothetical protein